MADTNPIHYTGPGVLVCTSLTYAPSLRPCITYALLQVNDHLPMPNQCRSKLRSSTQKCRLKYNLWINLKTGRSKGVEQCHLTHMTYDFRASGSFVPAESRTSEVWSRTFELWSRTTTFTRCQKTWDVVPIPEGDHSDVMSLFYGQYVPYKNLTAVTYMAVKQPQKAI